MIRNSEKTERACFKSFPYECEGCPKYREYTEHNRPMYRFIRGSDFIPGGNRGKLISKCERYNKKTWRDL